MATTNLSSYDKDKLPNAETFRFGIVVSKWNSNITFGLLKGIQETFSELNIPNKNFDIFYVPGGFELIYASNQLAKTNQYDAIISVGCVIRGETSHFDYVCSAISQGIKDININQETPCIFCILTDDNIQQSIARSGGTLGNKGVEAAITAIEMIKFKKDLES